MWLMDPSVNWSLRQWGVANAPTQRLVLPVDHETQRDDDKPRSSDDVHPWPDDLLGDRPPPIGSFFVADPSVLLSVRTELLGAG